MSTYGPPSASMNSSYTEFDDDQQYGGSGSIIPRFGSQQEVQREGASQRNTTATENRGRSFSINSSYHPKRITRSLSNTIDRFQSYAEYKGNLPVSTTSAQLRAATVRGEISATEEQSDVARAQRDKMSIHHRANEAVKAGNVAAVVRDDERYWIDHDRSIHSNTAPPHKKRSSTSDNILDDGSNLNSSTRHVSNHNGLLDSGNLVHGCIHSNGQENGSSKIRLPWDAMQSVSAAFSSRKMTSSNRTTTQEIVGNVNDTNDMNLEEKVLKMTQRILHESHSQSGALLDSITHIPDCKARARVKLIIEHPEQARAYIRMGLQNDPDLDMSQTIRMIDYYCTG